MKEPLDAFKSCKACTISVRTHESLGAIYGCRRPKMLWQWLKLLNRPKHIIYCQSSPSHSQHLEQPATLVLCWGISRPILVHLNAMEGTKVNTCCNSKEKHMANLRVQPHSRSHKYTKHPKPCEKHGGVCKTPSERAGCTNMKEWTMKPSVLWIKNECTYARLCD